MRRLVALSLLIFLLAPFANATPGAYGTEVSNNHADRVARYDLAFPGAVLGYLDIGSTANAPDATDGFVLDLTGNGVSLNDVILTSQAGGTAGSQVKSNNQYLGNALATTGLPATPFMTKDYAPVYAEGGPDGVFGRGDGLFIDVDGDTTTSTNDIIVYSPNGALGTRLTTTSNDVKEVIFDPLTEAVCDGATIVAGGGASCAGAIAVTTVYFEDTTVADNLLTAGEDVYLKAANTVGGGAFRVRYAAASATEPVFAPVLCGSSLKDTDCGDTIEKLGTAGITSASMATMALPAVVGHDADGSGGYSIGDGVYFDMDGDGLPSSDDVRLVGNGLPAGKQPRDTDSDLVHSLAVLNGGAYQFIFGSLDATLDSTENIVIDVNADGLVSLGDALITGHSPCILGDQRSASNTCHIGAWVVLPAKFGWKDENNNGVLDAADSVYLDQDGDGTLAVNDVRITKVGTKAAGSRLIGSDTTEVGKGVTILAAATLTYFDVNGNGAWDVNDDLYLDLDGNGYVTPGDVRLSKGISSGGFGTVVDNNDLDHVAVLTNVPGAATLDIWDVAGDGTQITDPVYLFTKTVGPVAAVGAFDLRLSAGVSNGHAGGAFVAATSNEVGKPVATVAMAFCYSDLDSSTSYTLGDGVYAHLGGCATTVGAKDVRISVPGFQAGTRVVNSDADANDALFAFAGTPKVQFLDSNSDGGLDAGDRVYFNVDDAAELLATPATSFASVRDVRLSGTGGTTTSTGAGAPGTTAPAPTSTSTSTASTTVTVTPTQTVTSSNTPTVTATQTVDENGNPVTGSGSGTSGAPGSTDNPTPGAGVLLVVAALGAALLVARRRI